MIPKLYEISEDIAKILGEEEWSEETEKRLESLGLDMEAKAKNILAFCADLEAFTDKAKAEEKRIAERRKAAENRAKRLKQYIQRCMEMAGRTEIETGTHNIKIQNNPPKAIVDDEEKIPAKYFIVIPATTQLDKAALLKDLKKGEVKGAHIEAGTHLRIR